MKNNYALYVTSFPPEKYRRPIFASRALRTIGLNTKILLGWDAVRKLRLNRVLKGTNFLPKPLNWLTRDLIYENSLFTTIPRDNNLVCCINLNILGVVSERIALRCNTPLIIDCQDVTLQDDASLPLYDREMIRMADAVIFTSKVLKALIEKQYPKILKRSTYVPFGIDLAKFDEVYKNVKAEYFLNEYSIKNKVILTYSGAAYFWGKREGQGLQLLIKAASIITKEKPEIKIILQGAASPKTFAWSWLQNEILRNNLKDKIILIPSLHPFHPLRMSLFKASKILLLPIGDILGTYYAEQQKLFEYMSTSKPIVMVATPARLSILDHSSAYIAYKKDPEEFAYQVISALEEPEEAEAKGIRARRIIEEKYDWSKLIPQYAHFISSVIEVN